VIIGDHVVAEMMLKAGVEAFVDMAPKDLSVVWENCIFGCYSPRVRPCMSPMLAMQLCLSGGHQWDHGSGDADHT
jgi:hypothetical protein